MENLTGRFWSTCEDPVRTEDLLTGDIIKSLAHGIGVIYDIRKTTKAIFPGSPNILKDLHFKQRYGPLKIEKEGELKPFGHPSKKTFHP